MSTRPAFFRWNTEPMTEDEDSLLALQARQNPQAFTTLYQRYVQRVYRYTLSRVGSTTDSEDITAQVFLEVLESLPRFQPSGCFAAWLFTIVRRRCADYYRRRKPAVPLENAGSLPFPAPDLLAAVIQEEEVQALARQLGLLEEDERELLFLRFAAGLQLNEIARLIERKESAVKMRLYRLLEKLGQRLEVETK